ncbi:CD9 family protein [Megaselia abdita]
MLSDPIILLSMSQLNNQYTFAIYIFLAVGLLILLGGMLGCCGSCKESKCMLVLFFCVFLIVLVAQLAAGAWAYCNRDKLDGLVRASVKYSVQEEYGHVSTRTVTFDAIQKNLKCCGGDGPSDWAASKYNNVDRNNAINVAVSNLNPFYNIPQTCCRENIAENECEISRKLKVGGAFNYSIYQTGCMDKLIEIIHENWIIVAGISIIIITLEIFALSFSLCLCCAIRRDHYKA